MFTSRRIGVSWMLTEIRYRRRYKNMNFARVNAIKRKIITLFSNAFEEMFLSQEGRLELIKHAQFSSDLKNQLMLGGPPAMFIPTLIDTVISYGCLDNGRNALEQLLETSKPLMQEPYQAECDQLLQEWRTALQAN